MTPSPTARAPPGHADANASTGFCANESSWSPGSSGSVSDKVWAQAIHAVSERRLSLNRAAQLYGLQEMALRRRVRHYEQLRQQQQQQQQQYEQLRQPPRRLPSGSSSTSDNTSVSNASSSDSAHGKSKSALGPVEANVANAANAANTNVRYVFPALNTLALEQRGVSCGSPNGPGFAPALARTGQAPVEPPASYELTPELNDEVVAVLREQFRQRRHRRRRTSMQQPYDAPRFYDDLAAASDVYDRDREANHSERFEGYADAEIVDVVRVIASRNGRCPLPPDFPSPRWLALFKRENGFADVDAISQPSPQRQQQQYEFEHEQQQRESEQLRWIRSEQYPQQPLQASPMPAQRPAFRWDARSDGGLPSQSPPRQYDARSDGNYRRGPGSATGSATGSASSGTSSQSGARHYRQSNLVPAKVWERAMEDVAIHGMSLRNAAKAHGVHFAALHRRLKKRAQHKLMSPCAPDYIPFEDEAGVVRVIHARAEMGVLLSFGELEELLRRTARKHRAELPEDVAQRLVRKFQSRVEQSVSHLVDDWPRPAPQSQPQPPNVLYRLRDASGDADGGGDAPGSGASASQSGSAHTSGEGGSLSPSGSSSSLSPRQQASFRSKAPLGPGESRVWTAKDVEMADSSTGSSNSPAEADADVSTPPTDGSGASAEEQKQKQPARGPQAMTLRL